MSDKLNRRAWFVLASIVAKKITATCCCRSCHFYGFDDGRLFGLFGLYM